MSTKFKSFLPSFLLLIILLSVVASIGRGAVMTNEDGKYKLQNLPAEEQQLLKPFFEPQHHAFRDFSPLFPAQANSQLNSINEMLHPNIFGTSATFGACSENLIDNSNFDAAAYGDQAWPDSASSGANHLIVWWDSRPLYPIPSTWKIWGTIVDEQKNFPKKYGIPINQTSTPKRYPKVAFNGQSYLVVWAEIRDNANLGSGIYGTFVSQDGKISDEKGFLIYDEPRPSWEYDPDIACSNDGICLVSWFTFYPISRNYQIFARFVYPDGSIGNVIEITPIGTSAYPSISYGEKAGIKKFLITYDQAFSGVDYAYAIKVNLDGTLDNAVMLSSSISLYPRSAFDGDRFLIAWWDWRRTEAFNDIYGAFLGFEHNDLSPEILLALGNPLAYEPQLEFANNHYLIVWNNRYATISLGSDILGKRVDKQGNELPPGIFIVNSSYLGQYLPTISASANLFMVAWLDYRNWIEEDIYASRVDFLGNVLDPDGFLADISINHQRYPSIAKANLSTTVKYLAAWEDNRSGGDLDIYGMILNSDGQPITNSFLIAGAQNIQGFARASYNQYTNKFIVVWQDQRAYYDGSLTSDIYEAVIDTDGNIIVAPHLIYQNTGLFDWNQSDIASSDAPPYMNLIAFPTSDGIKALCLNAAGIVLRGYIISALGNVSISWNGENFVVVNDNASNGEMIYSIINNNNDIGSECNLVSSAFLSNGWLPRVIYNNALQLQFVTFQSGSITGSGIFGLFTEKNGKIINPPGLISIIDKLYYWNMRASACVNGAENLVVWDYDEVGMANFTNQNLYYAKVYVDGSVVPVEAERVASSLTYHAYGSCQALSPIPPTNANRYLIVNEKYSTELKDTVRVAYEIMEGLSIISINPSGGCANGGFYVTITGTGFKEGAGVFFGANESAEVKVVDCHTIVAKVPASAISGTVDVIVQNPGGDQAILPAAFNYGSLVKINSFSPLTSPIGGGQSITVTGTDFTNQSLIILRAQLHDGTIWQQTIIPQYYPPGTLQFITPAAPEVLVADLCVKNPDCAEVCVPEAIGYYDMPHWNIPFNPQMGITAGNTPVTFWGPDNWSSQICAVKFDGISSPNLVRQNEKLIAYTPSHNEYDVSVALCDCAPTQHCYTLGTTYEYATFAYVTGSKPYLEAVDTYKDKLVDFDAYSPGYQSQIALTNPARTTSFTRNKLIPGRYAYAAMSTPQGLRVIKLDTGTSAIVGQYFIADPMAHAGDVAVAEYSVPLSGVPIPITYYALIVAVNHLQIAGYFGGVLILNPDTMQLVQAISIPELSLGQILNLAADSSKVYLSTLTGPIGGPQNQLLVTLSYNTKTGNWQVDCSLDDLAQISYPTPVDFANLGLAAISDPALNCQEVCLVAPEYHYSSGKDGSLACASNSCVTFNQIEQLETNMFNPAPYPQDVAIGKIALTPTTYDWKAFVVDSATDSWTRINGFCTSQEPKPKNDAKSTEGKTPVATKIRSANDKVYIVNMNSIDNPDPILDEVDIAVVRAYENDIWRRIKGISQDFHPRSISIQIVLEAVHFVEAAQTTINGMADSDFTTPSKRQVLLNKLDTIDHLLGTPANTQAIISNTRAFENQVNHFVANQAAAGQLIIFAEDIIKSVQQ